MKGGGDMVRLEWRRVVDMFENSAFRICVGTIGSSFDDRVFVVVILSSVLILVSDLSATEYCDVFLVELRHRVKGVAKQRGATFAGVLEAVEKLQSRRVGHVEKIHVETKALLGVGNILGLRNGFDIPGSSIECVAESSHAACNILHRCLRLRHVFQK